MSRLSDFLELRTKYYTRAVYKSVLKKFMETVYGKADLEQSVERYFTDNRNYETDVKKFFVSISGSPPMTIQTWISIVRTFLLENNIELRQLFWKQLRQKNRGVRAVSDEIVPSVEQLRRIVTHTTAKGKALVLVLASSGMRIGETLKLKISDVDFSFNPTRINVRAEYTKTNIKRTAFISGEATEVLQIWINERKLGTRFPDFTNEPRLFPFTKKSTYDIWNHMLSKEQLGDKDERTHRHKMHIHVLRKFARSRLGEVLTEDQSEAIIGHEDCYRKYSVEKLAEFYKRAEPTLTIFGTSTAEIEAFRKEIEESKKVVEKDKDDLLQRYLRVTKRLDEVMEILKRHEDRLTEQERTALNTSLAYSFEGLKEKLAKIDAILEMQGEQKLRLSRLEKRLARLEKKSKTIRSERRN